MAVADENIAFVQGAGAVKGVPSSGAVEGRFAVAARPLRPGDVALRAPCLGAVLHEQCRGQRCDWCLCRLPPADDKPASRCSRCKVTFYCSRECQAADWKAGHSAECRARPALRAALLAEGVPGGDALSDALLATRCVRASRAAAAAGGAASSGSVEDLESVEARLGPAEREQLRGIARAAAACEPRLLVGGVRDAEEAVYSALCCFQNNNFAVVDDLLIPIAAGCFPKGAAFNHSCAPNCMPSYDLVPGQAPRQVFRVMEGVDEGAELTHSYVDLALPTWERQADLKQAYAFDCACASCASGARARADGLLVSSATERGFAVPWGARGDECPLPRARPDPDRNRDLARADALQQEALAEEDAQQELRLLEQVCALRQRWLHVRHAQVLAAHAAAHTAALAGGAWRAAEQHCQRLVEGYLALYPPWHPITGLQMYTLGELKENSGCASEAQTWYERAAEILQLTHGKGHAMVESLAEHLQRLAPEAPCP